MSRVSRQILSISCNITDRPSYIHSINRFGLLSKCHLTLKPNLSVVQSRPPRYLFFDMSQIKTLVTTKNLPSKVDNSITPGHNPAANPYQTNEMKEDGFMRAIQDLNSLQSNTQVIALAKYKNPEAILPLFRRQMSIAGIKVEDLNKLNVIHVTGTKGKGSTCAFTESILRHAGLKTGFYNSPHLVSVTERIQINGAPISKESFAKYFRYIFDRLMEGTKREHITMPSYFSFLTILAFHIFLKENVDCAVIEVGMGGEYDPTNVIEKPVVCGITTLDFDHTNVLGKTIESIAWNKAGIIKSCVPVYTIKHEHVEAQHVIDKRARERHAPMRICPPLDPSSLRLGIQSPVQYVNAALACHLADHLLRARFQSLPSICRDLINMPDHFRSALESCKWAGRCQVIDLNDKVSFFLDGAHTKKSTANCVQWFETVSREKNPLAQQVLMVNIIGERDKTEVLKPLASYEGFSQIVFSTNRLNATGETPGSETFARTHGAFGEKGLENVKNNVLIWTSLRPDKQDRISAHSNTSDAIRALKPILSNADGCHILVTGSLHFVGAVIETITLQNKLLID